MDSVYAKLISKDKFGQLTEVYPEIRCDMELDMENKASTRPVANGVIAAALESEADASRNFVKNALSAIGSGIQWDEDTQTAYIDASDLPQDFLEDLISELVDQNGAIVVDEETGKLTVDFSKLTAAQIMALCASNGGITASTEQGENYGKLMVDFSKLPPEQIREVVGSMVDQQGAIIPNTNVSLDDPNYGKLTVDFSKLPPEQIREVVDSMVDKQGAIIPNTSVSTEDPNYGKLTVDFSKLSASQIMALCLAGGGITADQATGKLKIDFSQIDPATKRSITSALKMQTPLEATLTIYVDNVNGDDNYKDYNGIIIPGKGTQESGLIPHPITESTTWEFTDSRGRTVTRQYGYPFQTIGKAVTYISENFSLGSYDVNIRIISNTMDLPNGSTIAVPYYGSVSLPALNRTSGIVYIYSTDPENRATIMNTTTGGLFSASGSGANYELQKLDCKSIPFSTNGSTAYYVSSVGASSQAILNFVSCHFTVSYVGNKHPYHFSLRPFSTGSNGSIGYHLQSGNYNSIEYDTGKDPANRSNNVYPMFMQNSGKMTASSANANEVLELQLPLNSRDAMHQDVWDVPATTAIDEPTYQDYIADSSNGIADLQSTVVHLPVYDLTEEFTSLSSMEGIETLSTEQGYGIVQGSEEAVKAFLAALKDVPSEMSADASLDDILEMTGAKRIVTVAFKATEDSLVQTNANGTPYVGNKAFNTAFSTITWLKAHAERTLWHYKDRNSGLPAFRRVEILPHVNGDFSCTNDMAILRGTPEDLKAFFAVLAMDFKAKVVPSSLSSYLSAAESVYAEALAEYEAMWQADNEGTMPVQAKILLDERTLIDELLERRNNVDKREYAYIDRFILPDEPAAGAEPTVLQQNRAQMCQDLEAAGIDPEEEIILRGRKDLLAEFIEELCSKYDSVPAETLPAEIGLLRSIVSVELEEEEPTILDTEEAGAVILNGIQQTKIVRGTITNLGALLKELKTKNDGLGTSIWTYVHCDSLYGFQCSGTATTFIAVNSASSFYYSSGANYNQYFVVPPRKTATGRKFSVSGASVVTCSIKGAFPGDVQGTMDMRSSVSVPNWTMPTPMVPEIGTIMWFNIASGSGTPIITGWLPANGGQYKQKDYPDLYAILGDAYASVNGTPPSSGYFRVPNLTAELPSGAVPYIKAKN